MTKFQLKMFEEQSGMIYNKNMGLEGSWTHSPAPWPWFFAFKFEDETLYICKSNRMCGEHFKIIGRDDNIKSGKSGSQAEWNDMIVEEKKEFGC